MSHKLTDQDYFRLAEWGYGCYQQGDLHRARIIFAALLEARPTDSYAARGLAGVALQEGRPEEAVQVMAPVLTKHPHDIAARARLVESLIAAARFGEAQQGLASLSGSIPDTDWIRIELRLRHAINSQATSSQTSAITRM